MFDFISPIYCWENKPIKQPKVTARERGERPAGQGMRRPSNTLEGSSHPARVSPAPQTRHVPPGRRSPSAHPPAAPGPGGGRPLLRSPVAFSWSGCPSSSTAHREGNTGRRRNPCLGAPGAQGSEAGTGEPGCGPSVGARTVVCMSAPGLVEHGRHSERSSVSGVSPNPCHVGVGGVTSHHSQRRQGQARPRR